MENLNFNFLISFFHRDLKQRLQLFEGLGRVKNSSLVWQYNGELISFQDTFSTFPGQINKTAIIYEKVQHLLDLHVGLNY